jgi:hypothetical protein
MAAISDEAWGGRAMTNSPHYSDITVFAQYSCAGE